MKELLSCCVLGLVALSGYAAPKNGTVLPMAVSPESEGVSSLQVIRWLDACEQRIDCLHGFVFLRHGKVIAEGAWKPFDTLNEPHFLSSHTKCFISTAAGFLVDEGKLDLDERVIDVLPDKAPTRPSERLKSLRVRDLLTMNVGTKDEGWPHDMDGDWAKALLASEFVDDPGCQFKYNSGGTHVLGLIVARRSGCPLMDFLKERLFNKIGIEKAWTTYDAQGNACAGWGFSMTTREISLIGQLYLNKGVWQGKRLLSEDWVTLATCRQTWSGKTPTEFQPKNDWTYGFGFNWWRCQHGCYRADGSGGQYTIVFPKHDAVLSIHADVENMQQILDVVWTHFLPVFAKDRLPDAPKAVAELKARCASLSLKPVQGRRDGVDKSVLNRDFAFSDAPADIRGACLRESPDGWSLRLTTEAGAFDIPVGYGRWERGELKFSTRNHHPLGRLIGVQRVASSAAVQKDGSVKVCVHLLDGPRRIELTFKRSFFNSVAEGRVVGMWSFKSSRM